MKRTDSKCSVAANGEQDDVDSREGTVISYK